MIKWLNDYVVRNPLRVSGKKLKKIEQFLNIRCYVYIKEAHTMSLINGIYFLNNFILILNKNKRMKIDTSKLNNVKLNIGCGISVANGWINIDSGLEALFSKLPIQALYILKILYYKRFEYVTRYFDNYLVCDPEKFIEIIKNNSFIHYNLEFGIPLDNESVDFIYSSHFLEHLFLKDAKLLLKEAYRVLKIGGRIRICVPDLDFAVSLFQKNEKKRCLDFFFVNSKTNYYAVHKYMYDFELLKAFLQDIGFEAIEKCEFSKGQVPDIEILDVQEWSDRTLFVEAVKLK
jgi:predicted SAM-dependent methyltransferase